MWRLSHQLIGETSAAYQDIRTSRLGSASAGTESVVVPMSTTGPHFMQQHRVIVMCIV